VSIHTVDILIATSGRESLAQSILAAQSQTYSGARVVVIGDGPQPVARKIVKQYDRDNSIVYHETPEHFGHGNPVKEWWLNHSRCAAYVKFLDDDDWLAPIAIDEMMRRMSADVVLASCQMLVLKTDYARKRCIKTRICPGVMKPNMIGTGCMLVRSDAAQGVRFPLTNDCSDYHWALEVSRKGRVVNVPFPLYYYNGYRGNPQRPVPSKNAI